MAARKFDRNATASERCGLALSGSAQVLLCCLVMGKAQHLLVAAGLLLWSHWAWGTQVQIRESGAIPGLDTSTVVLADSGDPYRPLALEIARAESIPCHDSVDQALAQNARFLLWVGSPRYFTDQVLIQFAVQSRHLRTSTGLFTGNTMEDARALWQRKARVQGGSVYAVYGKLTAQPVFPGQIAAPDLFGVAGRRNLTKAELTDALKAADYLTFTGHGGGTYWRLDTGDAYRSADIPPLRPAVLATGSCQGVRLNVADSMALAAVAQGAAAYAGYLFSPIAGYLVGAFDGLPFRYTWPGVTVGEVVRIQNQGAVQGMAAFPFYQLVGDPRIALQPEASFAPLNIETVRGMRTYDYGDLPPGFFPIRVKGGAQYHFAEVPDLAAASDHDLFYNSRLQMIDSGADKILLVLHPGGGLQIQMRTEPPRFWRVTDSLLDALDHTFIFTRSSTNPWISVFSGIAALLALWYLWREERKQKRTLTSGILTGIGMALGHTAYVLLRIGQVTITSKPVAIGPVDIILTALLASCGATIFARHGSPVKLIAGVLVAVLPGTGAAALSFAFAFGFNMFFARPALGLGIYNYSMSLMALVGTLCQTIVFLLMVSFFSRFRRGQTWKT